MTGQAAFARTLRALDADDFRYSRLALLLAVIVLAAWIWWFVTPNIPSTMSETVALQWDPTGYRATVSNPKPEIFARLRQNQFVQLHFDGRTVAAKVLFQRERPKLDFSSPIPPLLPNHATIEIETGPISPAKIVLRSLHE